MDHLEEIRHRLSIEELVGGYVQLKKAGRNLRGLCPFHSEKTPSFMVSPEKGIAYCFGCHQGGDIFKFTQLVENVEFGEAVKILAQKTNVQLPHSLPKAHNKRLKNIEINELTVQFYQEQLEKFPQHKEYFTNRGLSDETISNFRLGYAPDSFNQLRDYLSPKGYAVSELVESSVICQKSMADKNTYDRFRNRLMFPIFDHQGSAVAMSGRIIGEGEPKYMNSPDTPAYNKSMVLYGLNWGKEAIKKEDLAIFVEGYMDVISAHQIGTKNVIATCGTAMTPQQLKLIKRFTNNIALAFDRDGAGMEATFRAIELGQLAEMNIKIVRIPGGKDPDECIKNNPEDWKNAITNPVSVMDFYFEYAFSHYDKESIEGKRQIIDFLLPLIKTYQRETEQGYFLNRLSVEIKTDVDLLWNDLRKMPEKSSKNYSTQRTEPDIQPTGKVFSREELLLGFIFNYPHLYEKVNTDLIDSIPLDSDTETFYNTLKKVYTRLSSITVDSVLEELSEENKEKVGIYSLYAEETYPDITDDIAELEVKKLIKETNRKNLEKVQKEVTFEIKSANNQSDAKELLNRLMEIAKLKAKI